MNHLLGQKLSITSRKPQTTRQQILGVQTGGDTQLVFIDTPGLHSGQPKAMNRLMNKAALSALTDVDVTLLLCDRMRWTDEDELALVAASKQGGPVALVINKLDLLTDHELLLPFTASLSDRCAFDTVLPISALRRQGLAELQRYLENKAPVAPHLFPEDHISDKSQRFFASELVREKIVRQLGDELPYSTAVEVESFSENSNGVLHIGMLILVERSGQKKILIGESGGRLKAIGTAARKDMERMFGQKVMLKLWVKVKAGWSDDVRALKTLGLDSQSNW